MYTHHRPNCNTNGRRSLSLRGGVFVRVSVRGKAEVQLSTASTTSQCSVASLVLLSYCRMSTSWRATRACPGNSAALPACSLAYASAHSTPVELITQSHKHNLYCNLPHAGCKSFVTIGHFGTLL